jgi:voltage-gated potassium channel
MKTFALQVAMFLESRTARRNLVLLRKFLLFLVALVLAYGTAFHFIMEREGQQHSWISGFYWTLVTMSTLGYGDIAFHSDLGRAFSMLVLLSGVVFLLVVLPFTFIQFFYAPWLEAQSRMRAPREVPRETSGHVILTEYDPVSVTLIERLKAHGYPYFVLESDLQRALNLHDTGVSVVLGQGDDVETFRRLGADRAALVVAAGDDFANTNVAFTLRELTTHVPIVAFCRAPESADILELAGSSHVLQLADMLGRSLARRALGGEARATVIGRFGDLVIAEAPVTGTPLVGKRLAESRLREETGVTVVGLWERGSFHVPGRETIIEPTTVLVMAGSEAQIARFNELTVIYSISEAPVLVLGGGRVGRAAAYALMERDVPSRIVEKDESRIKPGLDFILGSAADRECLERAGISEAGSVLVTTNDDATNIYLTIYCRKLRPDLQIVSRATMERNVSTLHRAGADFVMSYASMGSNAVYNILEGGDVIMLAEGLDVFRVPVPAALSGKRLDDSGIRESTGCSLVAVDRGGTMVINPGPDQVLPADGELILIGTTVAEREFADKFSRGKKG